jgi:hypothetical protein
LHSEADAVDRLHGADPSPEDEAPMDREVGLEVF